MTGSPWVRVRRSVDLLVVCLALHGCATPPVARYVYQDAEFGVIGMPANTFLGKTDYWQQAEILMARHFPEGHEIVRTEEVIEGQRTLDVLRRVEVGANPNVNAMNQMIKLGKLGQTTSYKEKDQIQAVECRIIYRRKARDLQSRPVEFASVAAVTPPLYVDPNERLRHESGPIAVRTLARDSEQAALNREQQVAAGLKDTTGQSFAIPGTPRETAVQSSAPASLTSAMATAIAP